MLPLHSFTMAQVTAFSLAKMLGKAVIDFNCKCFGKLGNVTAMRKICAGHIIVLGSCKVKESK
jgi:hypothetical protein